METRSASPRSLERPGIALAKGVWPLGIGACLVDEELARDS